MIFKKITIDKSLEDITGVDYVAMVDVPAHLLAFDHGEGTNDISSMYAVSDDDEMEVTGVLLREGYPIIRYDMETLEPYYTVFERQVIKDIREKFVRLNFFHNINKDHDQEQHIDGQFMLEQFLYDPEKGVELPKCLRSQNIRAGSWIAKYKITDKELFKQIKKKKYNGFSVEGYFFEEDLKVKQKYEKLTDLQKFFMARELEKLNKNPFFMKVLKKNAPI